MAGSFSPQKFSRITVQDLAARQLAMAADDPLQLIDVREPEEIAIAFIPGFEVLPLSEFRDWSVNIKERFDPQAETLVLCHHGQRSAQMCEWLVQQGFTDVKNIMGGIAAYSESVDPAIAQY
jgi:rhodanese-related sulfurtransferase